MLLTEQGTRLLKSEGLRTSSNLTPRTDRFLFHFLGCTKQKHVPRIRHCLKPVPARPGSLVGAGLLIEPLLTDNGLINRGNGRLPEFRICYRFHD